MKNHIIYIFLLAILPGATAFAQLEGKRFISGSAGLNFNNQDPTENRSANDYSLNLNIGLGKFRTATKTGEWLILGSLGGGKRNYDIQNEPITRTGINSFSLGTGYNWNFYKHFSDKFGIYGGPGFTLLYGYSKQIANAGNAYYETKLNRISFSLQVGAGAYYVLSDRWWLTGSIAFSNPVYLTYNFGKSESLVSTGESNDSGFEYKLTPAFNFPSVGLGLRYFLKD